MISILKNYNNDNIKTTITHITRDIFIYNENARNIFLKKSQKAKQQ